MKPLVICHANCADGFGAAFAAWLKLGDEAEYVPITYNTPKHTFKLSTSTADSDVNPLWVMGREIYILDFSFPRPQMDYIFTNAKRVVWLDHHKSAFEMAGVAPGVVTVEGTGWPLGEAGPHWSHLNNDKSGAMLAWEYFHPDTEVPMLIRHIDDYDRWQFKIDDTKEFNKALWSYAPWTFAQWKAILALTNHQYAQDEFNLGIGFNKEGAAILRAHDQNVQSVVKGAARACKMLHTKEQDASWYATHEHWEAEFDVNAAGLAANCPPHLTSDVGHELATQSGTFGLCWTLAKEDKNGVQLANCSLRSNGDYDVSAIAKAFGGGGHRNAAGFEVPIGTLLGWLK